MTEEEWLGCVDPALMRKFLENQRRLKISWRRRVWKQLGYPVYSLSHRKAMCFALACCRQVPFPEPSDGEILDSVERFAEGELSKQEMARIASAEFNRPNRYPGEPSPSILAWLSLFANGEESSLFHRDLIHGDTSSLGRLVGGVIDAITHSVSPTTRTSDRLRDFAERWRTASFATSAFLRDVVGFFPFRPVAFSPAWRTDTAVALASQMYESRDFNAMPILGDALQDAGCDSADVLNHCREPAVHVRGCWVVDLVLGKE
ncbi:hypothetical protein VT84_23850 [Gemmata sp. SH-PL17]|nr:hypothetical protein VT84_23850 [Gemmata sp. SH-PL17]